MIERVRSHRRAVRDEAGKTTEVENAVRAENITHAGDLPETVQVVSDGEALVVNVDGTLRRTTLEAILLWLQAHIQSGLSFNVPYIDDETGAWMRYNPDTGKYEDSGVVASGKSAYKYAVEGGYTGTEEDYKKQISSGPWISQHGKFVWNGDSSYPAIEIDDLRMVNELLAAIYNTKVRFYSDGKVSLKGVTEGGNSTQEVDVVLSGIATPVDDNDAANKGYVENAIQTAITGAIEGAY